jgi:hypothetical protein
MKKYEKGDKPPYLLGLLCLIPLVGAFVGVGLILYGIFKYKDKLLTCFGILGLVITIVVYSYLAHQLKYGKDETKSFNIIARREINMLKNDLELYKKKYGIYPDSLEQVRLINESSIIDDPFLVRKMDKSIKTKFFYIKDGGYYKLFSVGADQIQNTNDDIYPDK